MEVVLQMSTVPLPYSNVDARIAAQLRRIQEDEFDGLQSNKDDLKKLHDILNRLTKRTINKGVRLHLIYEHETMDNDAQYESHRTKIDTRIIYSPTICLTTPVRRSTFNNLCDTVHLYSILSRRTTRTDVPQHNHTDSIEPPQQSGAGAGAGAVADVRNLGNVGLQYALSNDSPELCIPTSVRIIFPTWFTGKPSEHRDVPNELPVSPQIFAYLDNISVYKAEWMYRTFFRILHAQARRDQSLSKSVHHALQYGIFVPPWMPKKLRCGSQNPHYIGEGTLLDIRLQRTTKGRVRLLLVLAAFWQEEPQFSQQLIRYLRDNADRLYEKHQFKETRKPEDKRRRKRIRTDGPLGVPGNDDPTTGNINSVPRTSSRDTSPQAVQHSRPSQRVLAPLHNAASSHSRSWPGFNVYAVHNGTPIVCCAGRECRMRDNPGAQKIAVDGSEDGFTSKCTSCRRPMHHLCGQGEDMEDRDCPDCAL